MEPLSQKSGFTLIELVVVMFLISIMFFFSIPRFQDSILADNTNTTSRWIISTAQALKVRAEHNQKLYILHISLDDNRMWVSNESMTESELDLAEQQGYEVSSDVRILDVEYPEKGKVSMGRADIFFNKNGYSDKVAIHIEGDAKQLTFLIEPFLSKIKLYDHYTSFEDY